MSKAKKSRSVISAESRRVVKGREKLRRYLKHFQGDDFTLLSTEEIHLWIRAFKTFEAGTFDERFDAFWRVMRPSLLAVTNDDPKYISSSEREAFLEKCSDQYRDKMKDFLPLDVDDMRLFDALVRKMFRATDVIYNPEISDRLLLDLYGQLVPREDQADIEFKNTNGDGWIYHNDRALWMKLDSKQMQTHIFKLANKHFRASKITFSSNKLETNWNKRIGDLCTFSGMFNLMKANNFYPNPLELKFDKVPWYIPVMGGKVFCAETGHVETRRREHLFTQETQFSYVEDYERSDSVIVNDSKTKDVLLNAEYEATVAISTLHSLFPAAMRLISGTFTNNDRLWFVLTRLGILLSGFCVREVLFVYGKGKGGKSTLFQVICEIIGDLGIVLQKSSFVKNKNETGSSHKTDLIRAVGRRFCLVDELESTDIMNETLLKNWASFQKIPMREIYGKQGEELLSSLIVFITNEPPRFSQEDTTIRERIRPVKGTTKYFDRDCPKNERPLNFTRLEEWTDGYSDAEDTYWVYRTSEKEEFCRSFRVVQEKKDELGSLICILTAMTYRLTKRGKTTNLPIPEVVQADGRSFFDESDVVETFLSEYFEDEKTYANAVSLRDVYEKFRSTFPELGIKNFTLQTFKRALSGKNLLFPTKAHRQIKVKKIFKNSNASTYTF